MASYKTLDSITTRIPISRCNMEELAAYQRTVEPRGGVLFARTQERVQKDAARKEIIDLFKNESWPGHLSILTMPGLDWAFERAVLGWREGKWMSLESPQRTKFYSIENDRAIYFAAINNNKMPGRLTPNALLSVESPPYFAEQAIKTKFIKRFYLGNIDNLMEESLRDLNPMRFDAAWLDYTGQLSIKRLNTIAAFYERIVNRVLIVTVLKARWDRDTSNAIERAGGHSAWLRSHLPGEVLHDLDYLDSSAMTQLAIRKVSWRSALV
jgi:hypothetical protein